MHAVGMSHNPGDVDRHMILDDLLACRYAGDDPRVFGINLDRVGVPRDQSSARARLLADAVRVDGDLVPGIDSVIQLSAKRLGLDQPVHGFLYNDPTPQAMCVHLGGHDRAAIMLSSGLVRLMSADELSFVIGHELGHMIFDHTLYPRPADASDEGTRLNWLALQRAGEISADRTGLLACGSIDVAFRTILKIGTGLGDEHLRFDLATFLDQLRQLNRIGGHGSGIIASHPILTVRMKALLWFDMSDTMRGLQGPGGHGIALQTVDQRVERLLEEATGALLSRVRAESFERATLWSVFFAIVSDGVFSKQEQKGMADVFGQPAVESALTFVRENGPEKVGMRFEDAMKEIRFHPETGRREFWRQLQDVLGNAGLEHTQRVRILHIVEDRLGLRVPA